MITGSSGGFYKLRVPVVGVLISEPYYLGSILAPGSFGNLSHECSKWTLPTSNSQIYSNL